MTTETETQTLRETHGTFMLPPLPGRDEPMDPCCGFFDYDAPLSTPKLKGLEFAISGEVTKFIEPEVLSMVRTLFRHIPMPETSSLRIAIEVTPLPPQDFVTRKKPPESSRHTLRPGGTADYSYSLFIPAIGLDRAESQRMLACAKTSRFVSMLGMPKLRRVALCTPADYFVFQMGSLFRWMLFADYPLKTFGIGNEAITPLASMRETHWERFFPQQPDAEAKGLYIPRSARFLSVDSEEEMAEVLFERMAGNAFDNAFDAHVTAVREAVEQSSVMQATATFDLSDFVEPRERYKQWAPRFMAVKDSGYLAQWVDTARQIAGADEEAAMATLWADGLGHQWWGA